MATHTVYYIRLQEEKRTAYGEAAPLSGLSPDFRDDLEEKIKSACAFINDGLPVSALPLDGFPSLQFAFETAALGLQYDQPFQYFQNDFVKGKSISINGLVWMDNRETMMEQAFKKVQQGFSCIKFKIGALDFDEECRMLEAVRKLWSAFKVEIRLDANGAFQPDEALEKLKDLSRFEIHSIEQPIRQGQWEYMQAFCRQSTIPIALDEELINVDVNEKGAQLLQQIRPDFLILKPTLLGGFKQSESWIREAQKLETGWWATSALESNIGLNAIAQWTSHLQTVLPQGLGTGALYTNNIPSPLHVKSGSLHYGQESNWVLPAFMR